MTLRNRVQQRQSLLQSRAEGETHMADVSSIVRQLKKERDLVAKQLSGIDAALTAFATVYRMPRRERRRMSLAGRKKIAAVQRARWAKFRAKQRG